MAIVVRCDSCRKISNASDDEVGQPVKCPYCQASFIAQAVDVFTDTGAEDEVGEEQKQEKGMAALLSATSRKRGSARKTIAIRRPAGVHAPAAAGAGHRKAAPQMASDFAETVLFICGVIALVGGGIGAILAFVTAGVVAGLAAVLNVLMASALLFGMASVLRYLRIIASKP